MANDPNTSAPKSKVAVRATLKVPDTTKESISSKDLLQALGAFQEEITKIMVALGTKGPGDVVSVGFALNFFERGITKVEKAEPGHPRLCSIEMDCNGPEDSIGSLPACPLSRLPTLVGRLLIGRHAEKPVVVS